MYTFTGCCKIKQSPKKDIQISLNVLFDFHVSVFCVFVFLCFYVFLCYCCLNF